MTVLGLSGLYRFGRVFGTLEWLINRRRRRRFAAALKRIMGADLTSDQRRRATREHFMQTRCDKLFYLVFDCIPRDTAAGLLSVGNKALLDDCLARGRGVYLAMSHLGALHVLGMLLALAGYKTAAVRDRNEGGMRRYVQDRFDRRYPEFQRMRVLFADSYPREIYRCLADGYMLGSAMDVRRVRQANQKVHEVTIFGEPRAFLSGPLRVALRCRAPVLQAFVVPESGFRYRLEIVSMLADPERIEDTETAVAGVMETYAATVEAYARKYPSLLTRT